MGYDYFLLLGLLDQERERRRGCNRSEEMREQKERVFKVGQVKKSKPSMEKSLEEWNEKT